MLQNFHQGGAFFSGRTFLSYYLNSLGFILENEDHFDCKLGTEKIEIKETFFVKKLTFIRSEDVTKIVCKDGQFSILDLSESEREKIAYLQEHIKKTVPHHFFNSHHETHPIRLEKNSSNGEFQIVPSAKDSIFIKLVLTHTIQIDPNSQEISIKNYLQKR